MMDVFKFFTAVCILLAGFASSAYAQGWEPVIEPTPLVPDYILAVDKNSQKLHLLVHKSPLHAEASFTCATGQAAGDKNVEGDLKTPEGVYFTTGKRTGLKDFELYGEMAFPLDFPNPVDRIKGKTGYGIWIHGRGKDLVPMDTKGCVALVNTDMDYLDENINPGAPVVIGEKVGWNDSGDAQAAESVELEKLVRKWAADWEARDNDFFAAYDPALFAKSERRSFKAFENRKKRIFSRAGWIDIEIYNLHALRGPDYWVTWFDQYYRSGRLSSSSAKRLYWQKVDGKWKIVGREYGPSISSLGDRYLETKKAGVEAFIDGWKKSWLSADLDNYISLYDSHARQGRRKGVSSIRKNKQSIWKEHSPSSLEFGKVSLREHPQGLEAVFRQEYSDSSGYSDKGLKKLVLRPEQDGWLIVDEQWRKL
ncbi:L,D-transpeptidase family protein [Desulfovibrio sp. JC010]|uniref:L,D-transpeptidase family protein n=1 Tax=Desulfovibrio sp. JC010 TaxID=2593641 RepID=UPI0013D23FEA|nr:L,D-transpeptidase family protein [Desulfovibrio sp. JC010]NDV28858.1 L,D-transpeptidase family protein [Desulfovibrio sp. JC010]